MSDFKNTTDKIIRELEVSLLQSKDPYQRQERIARIMGYFQHLNMLLEPDQSLSEQQRYVPIQDVNQRAITLFKLRFNELMTAENSWFWWLRGLRWKRQRASEALLHLVLLTNTPVHLWGIRFDDESTLRSMQRLIKNLFANHRNQSFDAVVLGAQLCKHDGLINHLCSVDNHRDYFNPLPKMLDEAKALDPAFSRRYFPFTRKSRMEAIRYYNAALQMIDDDKKSTRHQLHNSYANSSVIRVRLLDLALSYVNECYQSAQLRTGTVRKGGIRRTYADLFHEYAQLSAIYLQNLCDHKIEYDFATLIKNHNLTKMLLEYLSVGSSAGMNILEALKNQKDPQSAEILTHYSNKFQPKISVTLTREEMVTVIKHTAPEMPKTVDPSINIAVDLNKNLPVDTLAVIDKVEEKSNTVELAHKQNSFVPTQELSNLTPILSTEDPKPVEPTHGKNIDVSNQESTNVTQFATTQGGNPSLDAFAPPPPPPMPPVVKTAPLVLKKNNKQSASGSTKDVKNSGTNTDITAALAGSQFFKRQQQKGEQPNPTPATSEQSVESKKKEPQDFISQLSKNRKSTHKAPVATPESKKLSAVSASPKSPDNFSLINGIKGRGQRMNPDADTQVSKKVLIK